MKSIFQKTAVVCAVLLAGVLHAADPAGAVVIVNGDVRVDHLDAAALKEVYTGKTTYWDGGQNIVIAVLADQTDAVLKEVSGMDASQFKTFWQRLVFSGRGQQPKKAEDAASLVALVAATKGAIALVPADVPRKGVKTIEVK